MLFAAVLAGGRSSRMGQDKAGLQVAGQSLLDRALTLLAAAGADKVLIGGQVQGYEAVPDRVPHSGPPGGLYSILHHIRQQSGLDDSPLLLIPVDMPLLTPQVLVKLIQNLGKAQAIRYEGEVFPCIFRASSGLYRHLEELFTDGSGPGGDRSIKALLRHENARSIPIPAVDVRAFENINTPADWAALVKVENQG
ncbi:MAG: molybdenum cofactor guanylyltransferase [Pseudohongiellaceae bacterium]